MQKKNRKSKKKSPVIKTRVEMTRAEYSELLEQSSVRLYEYLCSTADSEMSDESRDRVARAIGDEFRYRMATDEVFFDKVNRFMHGKDVTDSIERSLFFFGITQELCKNGRIKEVIAARYPDEYRLPKDRTKKGRLFRTLSGGYNQ